MTNIVVKITLPKGLKLMSGAFLPQSLSLEVISDLSPYYASVPQLRLEGGPYMDKLKDTTIAVMIYHISGQSDQLNDRPPKLTTKEGKRFYAARNDYVIHAACYTLLVNLSGLVGYTGGHVLGNFSVTKQRGEPGSGFSAKLKDLQQGIDDYKVVVESGGKVIPGGHAMFMMAAKGLFDSEVAPGREWLVSGMGANSVTPEWYSGTGGRGKPMKFFMSPVVNIHYIDQRFMNPIINPAIRG